MRIVLSSILLMICLVAKADDFNFNKEAAILFAKSYLIQFLDQTKTPYDALNSTPIVVSGTDNESTKIILVIYPEVKNKKGSYSVVMYIKDGYFQHNSHGASIQSAVEMKEDFLNSPALLGE